MSQWIKQKFISVAILGTALASVATIGISYQQAIALPPATVNQIIKKSTVRIEGAGKGSGVIFARDDYGYVVLTNQHVVEDLGEYEIITADGTSHLVSEIQELGGADLALVYFDTDKQYSIIARGNSDTLIEGQKLYIAGYPGSQYIASNRTYRFLTESLIGFLAPSDIKNGYELIYSGEAVPGMSGSPIINEEGQLIGVYGLTDIDFTTGASYLYGIPVNTALKIAAESGIELDSPKNASDSSNGIIDLFDPSPGSSFIFSTQISGSGFEIEGNAEINSFTISEIVYVGECPGTKLESQEAMFFSNTVSTAPDRRVSITNITQGLERDSLPHIDREYKEGQTSDKTRVTLGSKRDRGNFVVLPGKNKIKYEIVQIEDDDRKTVLEEGTFAVMAKKVSHYVLRNKVPVEETYCPNNDKYCRQEKRKVRTVYKCLSSNRLFSDRSQLKQEN